MSMTKMSEQQDQKYYQIEKSSRFIYGTTFLRLNKCAEHSELNAMQCNASSNCFVLHSLSKRATELTPNFH